MFGGWIEGAPSENVPSLTATVELPDVWRMDRREGQD